MKTKIDNRSVFHFFGQCMKPYRLHFLLIALAPLTTSVAWPLFNHAIKLLIDGLTDLNTFAWAKLYLPCGLVLATELVMLIVWRLGELMEWKALPPVKKAIFTRAYDYLQHHHYSFFQDRPTSMLTDKVAQLLQGFRALFGALNGGLIYGLLQIATNFAVPVGEGHFNCVK